MSKFFNGLNIEFVNGVVEISNEAEFLNGSVVKDTATVHKIDNVKDLDDVINYLKFMRYEMRSPITV